MKKVVVNLISVILILSFLLLDCFAYFRADGIISHDESTYSKVQLLCNKGSSGNSLGILNSFYNISKDEKMIYLGLNGEFIGKEIDDTKIFKIIIYIDNKPSIEMYSNGEIEYDEQYFAIKSSIKIMFSSFKAEFEIIYKYIIPSNPKISVRIIDMDGINSKIMDLDTFIPIETTSNETQTKKPDKTNDDLKENNANKKTSSKAKKKKSGKTSSKSDTKKEEVTKSFEEICTENSSSSVVLSSNIEEENSERFKEKNLFIAISIGLLTAVIFTLIFINIKYWVSKSKEKKDKE